MFMKPFNFQGKNIRHTYLNDIELYNFKRIILFKKAVLFCSKKHQNYRTFKCCSTPYAEMYACIMALFTCLSVILLVLHLKKNAKSFASDICRAYKAVPVQNKPLTKAISLKITLNCYVRFVYRNSFLSESCPRLASKNTAL